MCIVPKFPLFTKELSKDDFEKKVKENPANSHLKVEIEVERSVINEEVAVEVDESNKPDFLFQYEQVKRENSNSVIFMHTGGFYIAFGKDAQTISKHTHYKATGKNLYGNVFTPCCEVIDFNLIARKINLFFKNSQEIFQLILPK